MSLHTMTSDLKKAGPAAGFREEASTAASLRADSFTGFTAHDFDTFHIEGLEGRMEAIRERIQPKFRSISEVLLQNLG